MVDYWKHFIDATAEGREYLKAKESERQQAAKREELKRFARQCQWIDRPDENEVEARGFWDRYEAAKGRPPFAMFRRGRSGDYQYLAVTEGFRGYEDIESAITRGRWRAADSDAF